MNKKLSFRVSEKDLKALIMSNIMKQLKQTNIWSLVGFPPGISVTELRAERAREALIKEFSRRTECLRGRTFYPEESYK